MQLLPCLLLVSIVALSTAEPLLRFFTTTGDDGRYVVKRMSRVRELQLKRDNDLASYPSKRTRELFGKRSGGSAEKRRTRELFGKRAQLDSDPAEEEEDSTQDYVYELLRELKGLKRERRARVRELLG